MSLLNFLQLQPLDIDADTDVRSAQVRTEEPIHLREDIDEAELDAFWDHVVADIHEDPEWFNFTND